MKIRTDTCLQAAFFAMFAFKGLAHAEVLPEYYLELDNVLSAAKDSKYTHILIGLNVKNSLDDLRRKSGEKNSSPFREQELEVLRAAWPGYVENSFWSNNLGQISLYTDENTIKLLSQHPLVTRIGLGFDRGTMFDPYSNIPKIERAISNNGHVKVRILPRLKSALWSLGKDGSSDFLQINSQQPNFTQEKSEFMASLSSRAVVDVESMRSQSLTNPGLPYVFADITLEGFIEIKTRSDIVGIEYAGESNAAPLSPIRVEPEVLKQAAENDSITVFIHLRRPLGYTPGLSVLSEDAKNSQRQSISKALREIINISDKKFILDGSDGLASALVVLTKEELDKIIQEADPRIESIAPNSFSGSPALNISLSSGPGGMNARYLHDNYNVKGEGQLIAVLDTGVRKSHPFFANKGYGEACYGTSMGLWVTTCPGADENGDNTAMTPGSGEPCGYAAFPKPGWPATHQCAHGTHVAGIATGIDQGNLRGVAPNASLIGINVMSQNTGNMTYGALDADVVLALGKVRSLRNIFVQFSVNMSFATAPGSGGLFAWNCYQQNPLMADKIKELFDLSTPTVAATGNSGQTNGIGFPACLPYVVKALASDKTNASIYSGSNRANPSLYSGPFMIAPGVSINSSVPGAGTGGGYGLATGTSMAAPHVTGAYAMIKSAAPNASVDDVTAFIRMTHSVAVVVPTSGAPTAIMHRIRFN